MNRRMVVLMVAVALAAGGGGFAAGRLLTEHAAASRTSATNPGSQGVGGGFGNGSGRRFGARPTVGTVASISGQTMTVTTNAGSTVTVSLSGNPTVTNNGSNAAMTDIQTGMTVMVFGATGSDGTVSARRVALNPTFGPAGGPGSSPNSTSGAGGSS